MKVKAADLSKALRHHVVPLLRSAGFDDATGRRFWRRNGTKVDHVEISSLSAYRALTDEATTASFQVRVGISLEHYGFENDPVHKDHIVFGPAGPRPSESQMPIRGVICPKDAPPLRLGQWGWECKSLWRVTSIDEVDRAAVDLRDQLSGYALEWMEREWDLRDILTLLQSVEKRLFITKHENGSHLQLDAGFPGSPIRQAHILMAENAIRAND
jgi:hypothetical protein